MAAKKTELLLVKKSAIEGVLERMEVRSTAGIAQKPENVAGDMWDKLMADWQALTAMKIQDGVAIIPLRGVITPDDPFAALYGETSLAAFNENFQSALNDPMVKGIVINAYSPGGYVYGVESAANTVFAARGQKPILAFTDNLAASAAYWLTSAADKVILGSETAEVGSIGVYLVHFDYSAMLADAGIKVTEITSGEFKGTGSPYAPLSETDVKNLQAESDYIYTRFVNTVARNRGMAVTDVLKSANGLTFYGSDAVKLGLADSINTLQEVIAMAQEPKAGAAVVEPTAEQRMAAEAAAKEKSALEAKVAAQEAELKAFREREAAAAAAVSTEECKAAIKKAYGREATAEEIKHYNELNADGRKLYKAQCEETARNRDKLIAKTGLTREQVNDGSDVEEGSLENNLVVQAARKLGLAVVTK